MTQLALTLRPRPALRPVEAVSVTHLLWQAAGRPTDTTDLHGTVDSARSPGARCWWCGHLAPDGWVRPRSCLPDTFPYPPEVAAPDSPWLCLPCGWTLCDRVRLPAEQGQAKIRARAAKGGRLIVSVRGAPPERWLVLEVADGRVGLWRVTGNAASDEDWLAEVNRLRTDPRPVGDHHLYGVVPYADLAPDATEKFRSYHHLAHVGRWWPCTDSDRMAIRAWLLEPPPPPWCAVIGDGKKHHALEAQRLDAITADRGPCVVYHRGAVVTYAPADLARQIASVEALVVAGASDEEIERGSYAPRSLDLLRAVREHEPVVAEIRGGPTLPLVLYLRRNRKELGC